MKFFDIIASRAEDVGLGIYADSIPETEMETVVKVCRKHGVDFIFCGNGALYMKSDRFKFMFFVKTGKRNSNEDRLMGCINELDLRTGLMFDVSYMSGSAYENPVYLSGFLLETQTHKPVACCLVDGSVTTEEALRTGGFYDVSIRYLVVTCDVLKPGDKPEKRRTLNLGSAVSELYGRLVVIARNFRAECKIRRCSLEWLRKYVPVEGIVRAFRFEFSGCVDVDDFLLAVVQYADGSMLVAVVRSDGCAEVKGCSLYMFDCVTMLAEKYLSGELSVYPFGDEEREYVIKVVADNERKKMIQYADERV